MHGSAPIRSESSATVPNGVSLSDGGPLIWNRDWPCTLVEALSHAAALKTGVTFILNSNERLTYSYEAFLTRAARILTGLRRAGLVVGERVLIAFDRNDDFLLTWWGCVLGGFLPAAVSIEEAYRSTSTRRAQISGAFQALGLPRLIMPRLGGNTSLLDNAGFVTQRLVFEELLDNEPALNFHQARPDDHAMILLTSGSTGQPKVVPLSHRNLLSMAAGTAVQQQFTPTEITLNWLPLDHVGAISFLHLLPTFLGCQQVHVCPGVVMRDIRLWLDLISEFRATISWAPNFAFRLVLEREAASGSRSLDLTRLRFLVNAGEAVVQQTLQAFSERLSSYGFLPNSIRPAFGMSETCSGATWSAGFEPNSLNKFDMVDLGRPIPGMKLRIVDEQGEIVPEATEGELQLTGESVFKGYWSTTGIDRSAFTKDGWFRTGDLGSLTAGQLRISGRSKNTVIVNGVHYQSHAIEAVVEQVRGVEATYTAACAIRRAGSDTDSLAIFFHPQGGLATSLPTVVSSIRTRVSQELGIRPDILIAVEKEDIPKTAIGKIQRDHLRRRFEAGELREARVWDAIAASDAKHSIAPGAPQGASSVVDSISLQLSLYRIVSQVLNIESFGLDENFFDLGATSMLLAEVESRIRDELCLTLQTTDLLAYPSVRALSAFLGDGPSIRPEMSNAPLAIGPKRNARSTGIAIIGMSARFPGAPNTEEYWQVLRDGRETITRFTPEELLAAGESTERLNDPRYVPAAGWLDHFDCFDAKLFGIAEHESKALDPQQRLFLEGAWAALEDAGYDSARFPQRIGLFGSVGLNLYAALTHTLPDLAGNFTADLLTSAPDFLATRASYKLNLRGPAMTVLAACSSSLAAVHLACQALYDGTCEMALAGAASIWFLKKQGYLFVDGGLVSPDGHCRAFDARAQGMVFGNGAGFVVLKPVEQARAAGDTIHAIIRGSAINNDGSSKAGFLATGMEGQATVIASAIRESGVDPKSIGYVECHGTGTLLGDAIEVTALQNAFRAVGVDTIRCPIGSAKASIGHLGAACGIAGLIKTVLALQHRQVPPTPGFQTPNPQLAARGSQFFVNADLMDWDSTGDVRRAGVSSFGLGGTNVHLVLEEADTLPRPQSSSHNQLLVLSARTPQALAEQRRNLRRFLIAHPATVLPNLAFTLQIGRRELEYRWCAVVTDVLEAVQQLDNESNDDFTRAVQPHLLWTANDSKRAADIKLLIDAEVLIDSAEGKASQLAIASDRGALEPKYLAALGRLWQSGYQIDWRGLHPTPPNRISLPTYPFERKRYWLDLDESPTQRKDTSNVLHSSATPDAVPEVWHRERGYANLELLDELRALPAESRASRLESFLRDQLSLLTPGMPASEIDSNTGFIDLGITSQGLVELAARVQQSLRLRLPVTVGLEYPTLAQLVNFLLVQIFPAPLPTSAHRPTVVVPLDTNTAEIARLSDEEALRMLRDES